MSERFYYCREHDHELGWSVRVEGKKEPIAYGDKNICCAMAAIMNKNESFDAKKMLEEVAAYF